MDDFVTLVYVGLHDEVEVDGLDELVTRGEPLEVHAVLAGRAPHGHRVDEDFDPGEGLLAQPDNWQRYESRRRTKRQQAAIDKAVAEAEAATAAALAAEEQAAAEAAAAAAAEQGNDDAPEGQAQ